MRKSVMLGKKSRTLTGDYRKPIDAQIRCLFPGWHARDEVLFEAYAKGELRHQRLGVEQVSFDLRESKNPVNSDVVLADFEEQKLEPANITELIAFRRKYPRITTGRRIIALGTTLMVKGKEYVPWYGSGADGLLLKLEFNRRTDVGMWRFGSVFLGIVEGSREKIAVVTKERRL